LQIGVDRCYMLIGDGYVFGHTLGCF
jgi:hypothetical protein